MGVICVGVSAFGFWVGGGCFAGLVGFCAVFGFVVGCGL